LVPREVVVVQIGRYCRRLSLPAVTLTPVEQDWLEAWSRGEPVPTTERWRLLLERVLLVMRSFDQGGEWFDGDHPPIHGRRVVR